MMDVSIVIVNWNSKELLKSCLSSINNNTSGIDYEIIVVDNNSSDDSKRMVKNDFPKVRLIENDVNKGFAKACNEGLNYCAGNYVLFLNPDTIIMNNAISVEYRIRNAIITNKICIT